MVGTAGAILGCDFAGVVEQVGPQAPGHWKRGDRIAGVVHGGLYKDKGAYAEYLKVDGDLAWKPPASMSDADASTYGVSAATAMQALFTKLDLPWPTAQSTRGQDPASSSGSDKHVIFIYGGSAAASLYAIQLASLVGWTVVTTCSPRNFDLVKSYGATAAYDYNAKDVVETIKRDYPKITRAFDGISIPSSTKLCSQLVQPSGGKICVLLDTRKAGKAPGVQIDWIMSYTMFGHAFAWLKPLGPLLGLSWPAVPEDREALARFYALLPQITDRLKPIPTTPVEGGFEGLKVAMQMLEEKKVSGGKLTVKLSD